MKTELLKNIIEAKITNSNFNLLLNKTFDSIKKSEKFVVFYLNFHSALLLKNNKDLKLIFKKANLIFQDGTGISIASKLLSEKNKLSRFNWTDYANDYLKKTEINKWKIYFLGSEDSTINKAIVEVKNQYPNLKLVGYSNGYEDILDSNLLNKINDSNCDILWVGMGTPIQEKWVVENMKNIHPCYIQTVGDLFSHLAGERKEVQDLLEKLVLNG